ncbi:Leucine-rich repeat-containing N-terminal [Theobroma cacao]|nr:Leucine-rich repeat-containing N-terminal [Theobroma cacao]
MDMRKLHFLSSALFIHCCFLVSYAMIAVRNLTTDQHALLEFKDQTIDPHNILANNWTNTQSVCNWVGVYGSAKQSHSFEPSQQASYRNCPSTPRKSLLPTS